MTIGSRLDPLVDSDRELALEVLRGAAKLIVVTHEHPDGDALGSLVAAQHMLTALGKDCLMFIAEGEFPLPYEYRFLPLDGLVTAAPEDLDDRTVVFLDCGNVERNPAAEVLLHGSGPTLNIDHHHDNTRFADVNHVDPTASCTAEIVWDLMHALEVELTLPIADALYIGVITDTGCFMYENTGPRAHIMAAELIGGGVDVNAMYQRVYDSAAEQAGRRYVGHARLGRLLGGGVRRRHLQLRGRPIPRLGSGRAHAWPVAQQAGRRHGDDARRGRVLGRRFRRRRVLLRRRAV